MRKSLYMETTKIAVGSTIGEITRELSAAGAEQILTDYQDRQPTGVKFAIRIATGQLVWFCLPARVEPVFVHLQKQRSPKTREKMQDADREQAQRVAWRQILRWVEAQIALLDTGMAKAEEIFLPYLVTPNGQTLFAAFEENGFKQLTAGEASR